MRVAGYSTIARRNIPLEILVRVVADIILLNLGLILALLVRAEFIHDKNSTPEAMATIFLRATLFLSTVGPLLFGAWGFYTKGRAYSSKYKMLVVTQASGTVFLLFAFTNWMTVSYGALSRLVVVGTWLFATLLLMGARLWARVWQVVLEREQVLAPAMLAGDERTVLLIGGAGYIGSGLLPRLLEKGYKVRLLDLFIYGEEPIAEWLHHPNLEVIRSDFRNVHDVVRAMRGVGAVIHLGAIVGDPACALDEQLTIEINLVATRTIAEVAKARGVRRFIFASTCSVYGANDEILNERSALNPVSLYARSKIACEQVLLNLHDSDFTIVLLRFGTIYGLSGRTRFDLVVNLLAAKAAVDGRITVFGREQWRPFVHVHDAARAVLAALEATPAQVSDVIFNVGSNEQNYTLGAVGEMIHRLVPSAEFICTDGNSDRRNYRVDFARIRSLLNFTPEWTLEQGVEQVLEAIRSGRVQDYRDCRYSNVMYLREGSARQDLKSNGDWAKELIANVPRDVIDTVPKVAAQTA